MIDRLNFYDVYGYLIPGLVLLGALWLPFQLATTVPLPAQWASAFVAVVLGYVAGHLLRMLADAAFPHEREVAGGERRRFSSLILDDEASALVDKEFKLSDQLRVSLKRRIRSDFGIDVDRTQGENDTRGMEQRRQDAFMLCRAALIQKNAAAYAQQFQGMYALMQGLTAAATIAIFYYAGWSLAGWIGPISKGSRIGLVVAVAAFVIVTAFAKSGRYAFWLLALASAITGLLFGNAWPVSDRVFYLLLGAGASAFFVAWRCHAAFLKFAQYFAATVYRDFMRT